MCLLLSSDKARQLCSYVSRAIIIQLIMHWLLQLCSSRTLAPLQQVQAATSLHMASHIASVLHLHWLPVRFRIIFKAATTTHNIFHRCSASYLNDLVTLCTVSDSQQRHLHSPSTGSVTDHHTSGLSRKNSVCWHVVWVSGPDVLNSLPHTVRSLRLIDSHTTFQPALRPILLKVLLRAF